MPQDADDEQTGFLELAMRLKREPWKGLSFDDASKGVVACDGDGRGCVLWAVGAHLRFEMEECCLFGLGDLGLDGAPTGISIWEGKYLWQSGDGECPQDGEMSPEGVFRAPTDEEWQAIRAGRCPWDGPGARAEGAE